MSKHKPTEGRDMKAPTVVEIMSDPSASTWLKDALRAAIRRDPVDAANDAEVLAVVLSARCAALAPWTACAACARLRRERS